MNTFCQKKIKLDHCCWVNLLYRVAHVNLAALWWSVWRCFATGRLHYMPRAASCRRTVLLLIWNVPPSFLMFLCVHLNLFLWCDVTIFLSFAAFNFGGWLGVWISTTLPVQLYLILKFPIVFLLKCAATSLHDIALNIPIASYLWFLFSRGILKRGEEINSYCLSVKL